MEQSGVNKKILLEEEVLIVRYSGEIPEVALHGSLYYLTEDPEGPGIVLDHDDLHSLKEAVVERYLEIILRDLAPENRDERVFRGLARCVANWQRMCNFCRKDKKDIAHIRLKTAKALKRFISRELSDVKSGRRTSCVNCSLTDLKYLLAELRLNPDDLPSDWQCLCSDRVLTTSAPL